MGNLSSARRIIRNAGFLTAGKIAGDLFTFLFFVVVTRVFGPEGIGKYSFAMAFTGFFTVLLGLYDYSIKEISKYPGDKRDCYGHLLTYRLVVSVITFGAILLVVPFLTFPRETKAIILIIGSYQVLTRLMGAFLTVYMAFENMHRSALNDFLLRGAIACVCIAICYMGGGLVLVVGALPVVTMAFLVINYVVVTRQYGKPNLAITLADFAETIRKAFPYYLSAFNFHLTSRVDVLLLGFLLGTEIAGVYNVAFKVVYLFLAFPGLLSITLLPMASRLGLRSKGELAEMSGTSLNLVVLIGLPMAAGLCYVAPQVIQLLYGVEFIAAIPVLQILSWLILLECLKSQLGIFLVACDRQADRTRAEIVAALSNILLNLMLIPRFGLIGAALATLFSQSLLILLLMGKYSKVLGWPRIGARLVIAASGCMAFYIVCNTLKIESIFLVIPLSALVYLLIVMAFSSIRKGEYRLLVALLARRGNATANKTDRVKE